MSEELLQGCAPGSYLSPWTQWGWRGWDQTHHCGGNAQMQELDDGAFGNEVPLRLGLGNGGF